MLHLAFAYAAFVAHALLASVTESQPVHGCHNISLSTEPNQTVSISTLEWSETLIDEVPRYLAATCWNLTARAGRQFRGSCRYRDPRVGSLYLVFGQTLLRRGWYPAQFEAAGPQLTVVAAIDGTNGSVSCSVQSAPDASATLCGTANINLTNEYLLNITVPGSRFFQECVWLVTSDPGTVLYIDFLSLDMYDLTQRFAFGRGHDPTNATSQFLVLHGSDYEPNIGSTFFLEEETEVWIAFSFGIFDNEDDRTQELLLRSENFTGEFHCRPGQVLCRKDSKCLPLHTVCDGKKHCSDFVDEAGNCDRCGISDISLRLGQPTTLLADFQGTPEINWDLLFWETRYSGHFAVFPGDASTLPNATSSPGEGGVFVSNYTGLGAPLECVWLVGQPPGARIGVRVAEFEGPGLEVRVGNGLDPAGVPLVVLMGSAGGSTPLPLEIYSVGSGLWVTLEERSPVRFNFRLRLVFTTYNVTECDEGHFACPSGLDCLDNVSQVCNGQKECTAYGDELGCGDCDPSEFKCGLSDVCVPGYTLCDGSFDCEDHSDEVMCGFCGNETVHLFANETYPLRHGYVDASCLWVFVAEPGRKIQARLRQLDRSCVLTVGRARDAPIPADRLEVVRQIRLDSPRTASYPRSLSANSSVMWIKIERLFHHSSPPGDILRVDIRQFKDIGCSSDEYTCPSGLACVPEIARCDGRADCPEYGDEMGCGNCSTGEFSCRSGQSCVASDQLCNGIKDCPDFSDEFGCAPCGDSYIDASVGRSTVLTSPGWPEERYPRNSRCLWLVVAEVGFRVTVSLLDFFLEESYDFLHFGDGDGFQESFLTVTGNRFPLSVSSTNNTAFVKFTSDYSIQESGFQLRVEQNLAETVACGEDEVTCKADHLICVRNDSSEQGLQFCSKGACGRQVIYLFGHWADLNSPGYPSPYPSDLACRWEIRSKYDVLVSVLEFSTEPLRDAARFQGGTLDGGEAVTFQLDGSTKVRTMAFNSSVVVSFSTDSTVEYGGFRLRLFSNFSAAEANTSCPDSSLFDCGDGSCLAPDARCDGFRDCQTHGLDEQDCEDVTCPEFYHCDESSECIHWPLVCDGVPDCPFQDDEKDDLCKKRCPAGCRCEVDAGGVHVSCKHGWNVSTLANLVKRTDHLLLSGANAGTLDKGLFKDYSFLKSLRLNNNNIYSIQPETFLGLTNLTFLDISNNSLASLAANGFRELQSLDVMIATAIPLQVIHEKAFDGLKSLRILVLIKGSASNDTSDVTVDVKDGALTDLLGLEKLYVDDYRLCCEFASSVRFDVSNCVTTELQPPLNLCGSLMRNTLLRVAVWLLGLSALIGNVAVVVWRCCRGDGEKGAKNNTHSLFVLNLAASDLLMGVYMLMIGVADLYFGEAYSRVAKQWRASPPCKIAGVLSVLSSEASVFFVTLISLDSFLAIVFPFSRVRLRGNSAAGAVAFLWLASAALSLGPTVFVDSDSEIYGLSDVCIGLPLLTKPTSYVIEENDIGVNPGWSDTVQVPVGTGKQPAWIYSIVLFLGVNLLCFLVVLVCYAAIFVKVKRTVSRVRRAAHRDREIKMAVKMALIVGTDFACWMPVIVMGILSQTGAVDIGPDMYAWIVVFILPINSSLNPYMYTFYTQLTTRRLARSPTAAASQKARFTAEMHTKSLETLHSTVSDNKSP